MAEWHLFIQRPQILLLTALSKASVELTQPPISSVFMIWEQAPLHNCFPYLCNLPRSSKATLSPLQLSVQSSLLFGPPHWSTKIQMSLPFQEVLPFLLWSKLWGPQTACFQETTISSVQKKLLGAPSAWDQPLQLLLPSWRGILKGNLAYRLFNLTLLGERCRWLFSAANLKPPLMRLVDITGNFTARLSNSLSCDWAVFTHHRKAINGLGKP